MDNCTSIKQIRRLLELGMDPKTSDMSWYIDSKRIPNHYPDCHYRDMDENHLPCWSLGRLIDIVSEKFPNVCLLCNKTEQRQDCCFSFEIKNASDTVIDESFSGETKIDPVVDAVCWLLENNFIGLGANNL